MVSGDTIKSFEIEDPEDPEKVVTVEMSVLDRIKLRYQERLISQIVRLVNGR
jgi:hypothetical protein